MMELESGGLGILFGHSKPKGVTAARHKRVQILFLLAKLKAQPATMKPAQRMVYFLLSISASLFVVGISTSKIY